MGAVMRPQEVVYRDPGVDLGRRDRGVPENGLDVADVCTAPEQVGRAGVPKDVRRDPFADVRSGCVKRDQAIERLEADPASSEC